MQIRFIHSFFIHKIINSGFFVIANMEESFGFSGNMNYSYRSASIPTLPVSISALSSLFVSESLNRISCRGPPALPADG